MTIKLNNAIAMQKGLGVTETHQRVFSSTASSHTSRSHSKNKEIEKMKWPEKKGVTNDKKPTGDKQGSLVFASNPLYIYESDDKTV